jgi:hypothetical protein
MLSATLVRARSALTDIQKKLARLAGDASVFLRKQKLEAVAKRIEEDLQKPAPKPRYPLKWKSEKQRRYVMALLRRTNNLPYQRTGELAKGWRVNVVTAREGGVILAVNNTSYAQFVMGDWKQPMFPQWRASADVLQPYRDELKTAVVQDWYDFLRPES